MVQCYCTSNKGCFTAFHDLPATALWFRVLCNVLHTIIVIEKVQFWDDAFLAVVGIKIHPDYFHVHMCKHDTTKSNIDLFATHVYLLHLVKVRVIPLECRVTSCQVWVVCVDEQSARQYLLSELLDQCTTRSLQPTHMQGIIVINKCRHTQINSFQCSTSFANIHHKYSLCFC